jgi:glycosyltransferase involved in cell wall biosynthesis
MVLLSVIIPVYNEAGTIREILEKINAVSLDKEIVVVDDGSSDTTPQVLKNISYPNLKIVYHSSNRGKGAAFLTGLSQAKGEYVIIQDADLEYEPAEYLKLLLALQETSADMVLGARFTKGYKGLLIPKFGNRLLTNFLNLLFGVRLNDFMSCYKLFRREALLALGLKAKGFDLEAEIVTKALKKHLFIREVPVTYHPRSYRQGKKIRIKDGLRVVWAILRYRLSST